MGKIPQISHKRAIRAFEKLGFKVIRQSKHVSMYDGRNIIIIPRANPINTYSLKGIIDDSGVEISDFLNAL
ncbi:MAG: type II toxin-antitoxin system HicA family toxin [Actinomycetota bacterium]|nr:type II toxin-antitoxin system HicA family toxin [Actinomycetota bacterium]